MKWSRFSFVMCLGLLAGPAWGQFEVELSFDSETYLKYEPIVAHVKIKNVAGHTIGLFSQANKPWLSFYVSRSTGEQVGELGGEYDLQQVQIAGGDYVNMNVNLTPVYDIREPGFYRVMATVYSASYSRQFKSDVRQFDLTVGRQLWQQTIPVVPTSASSQSAPAATNPPPAAVANEETVTYVLVAKRGAHGERLYARVEDEAKNKVYGVMYLGSLLGFGKPEAMIDRAGHLHVLHQIGSRMFSYVNITPDGKIAVRKTYSNLKSKPEFQRDRDGVVRVLGGEQTSSSPSIVMMPETGSTTADTPAPKK